MKLGVCGGVKNAVYTVFTESIYDIHVVNFGGKKEQGSRAEPCFLSIDVPNPSRSRCRDTQDTLPGFLRRLAPRKDFHSINLNKLYL